MNTTLIALTMTLGQPVAMPPGHAGPPVIPAAPFLFANVKAPGAAKVTWHPGSAEETATTGTVGLRPGYSYRFALTDVGPKGTVLHPRVEVLGTLFPRLGLADVTKHPVPITLTENDIDRILDGQLVTKVYYLEDPETALPLQGVPGEALEAPAASEEEAIRDARLRGRPMLVFRVGERPATREELAAENVPGTILFPGVKVPPMPAAAPRFPFGGVWVYDPILGPKAASEEAMKDGGDSGPRMAQGPGGDFGALDPTDTGMLYTNSKGTKVAPSNRICICVPRFAAARVEVGPKRHHAVRAPEAMHHVTPVGNLVVGFGPGQLTTVDRLHGFIGSKRASGMQSVAGPAAFDKWSGRPMGLVNIQGIATLAQSRGPEEITSFPGCTTLMIVKSADPKEPAAIGDIVTITLRFTNPTTEAMTDIVIADSLTTRLEYVEGSAKSSRPATFTASPNRAGSVVVRWALDAPLKPGEGGKVTFQVKVR